MIFVISSIKASGSSTNAWASESGLSSTMAMSISPPSFLMRVVLSCCILFKIATALFSHTFRSHSSTALWASSPVVPVSLETSIDVPMLGTIIEQNGDRLLEESHMPVGWPLHIDGAQSSLEQMVHGTENRPHLKPNADQCGSRHYTKDVTVK